MCVPPCHRVLCGVIVVCAFCTSFDIFFSTYSLPFFFFLSHAFHLFDRILFFVAFILRSCTFVPVCLPFKICIRGTVLHNCIMRCGARQPFCAFLFRRCHTIDSPLAARTQKCIRQSHTECNVTISMFSFFFLSFFLFRVLHKESAPNNEYVCWCASTNTAYANASKQFINFSMHNENYYFI